MKLKQYLVIDDNELDVDFLKKQLVRFPLFHLAAAVATVEAAIEVLATQAIDLIFLDVRLTDQSGLTLLRSVASLPPVVIISAYPEYAIESYEIGKTSDYLLKPFTEERLHIALTRALQYQINADYIIEKNAIFLKLGRKIQRFEYQSIEYIEAFGGYSKVYANGQMNLVNERLSLLTKLLPIRFFMRVHKSYLINISMITGYDRNNLWQGKTKIPIGVSFRPRVESLLSLFNSTEDDESE